jgi:HSP20 family molecular chaperone IbpA
MVDSGDFYQFLIDVPGTAMKDISIKLVGPDGMLIRVQANRAMPFAGGAARFKLGPTGQQPQLVSGERLQPPYERLVRIPMDGDQQRATAKLAAGVLNITVI